MFFHQQLLSRTGPLGLIWIAGHFKSRKITKKKVLEADLVTVCEDLERHIKKFALPVRASLVLGASIICLRKTTYLQKDVEELKKRLFSRRNVQAEINMKEIPPEKIGKNLDYEPPQFNFGHALLDIDYALMEEELPEIDYVQMRQNMADPNMITMPGETVITRKTTVLSNQLEDDFPDEGGPGFAQALEDLRKANQSHQSYVSGGDDPRSFTPGTPLKLNFDEELGDSGLIGDVPPVPPPPSAHSPTSSIEIAKKIRRRRVKKDLLTQIPAAVLKENLAGAIIDSITRKQEDVLINIAAIEQRDNEKRAASIGASELGKRLGAFAIGNARDAKRMALDRWVEAADDEDPFAWCSADGAKTDKPVKEKPAPPKKPVSVADSHFSPLPDMATPGPTRMDMDFPPDHSHGGQSNFASDEAVFVEPPAKRARKELTEEQRLQRYNMCGAFIESRYQTKQKKNSVLFSDLMDGNDRKKVARCFHFILKKAAEGRIIVEQEFDYGPIRIQKVDPRYSLEGWKTGFLAT